MSFLPSSCQKSFISVHFRAVSVQNESRLGDDLLGVKSLEVRDLGVVAGVGFEPTAFRL
jgi:hypothetical protein